MALIIGTLQMRPALEMEFVESHAERVQKRHTTNLIQSRENIRWKKLFLSFRPRALISK